MKRSRSTKILGINHWDKTHTKNAIAEARSPSEKPQKLPTVHRQQEDGKRPKQIGL